LWKTPVPLVVPPAGLVSDIGNRPAGPDAAADLVALAQCTMPFLLAALQGLKAAALERKSRILGLGDAQIVDEVVHLMQRHRIAREEPRHLLPPRGRDRVPAQAAPRDHPCHVAAIALCTRDRAPEPLLAPRHT